MEKTRPVITSPTPCSARNSSRPVGTSCFMLSGIDGDHLRFDFLAGFQHFLGMIESFFSSDLADVNKSLDAFGKLYERSELGKAGDGTLDCRTDRVLLRSIRPWIAQRLLQPERDAPLARINAENYRLDDFARFDQIAGGPDLFRP